MAIRHEVADDGTHHIWVDSPRLDSDELVFVFSEEGVVTDAVTGGVVVGTASAMYDEMEDRLLPS